MLNNSTKINIANNHLLPSLTEHEKGGTTTYDIENPGPGLLPHTVEFVYNKVQGNLDLISL